MPLGAFKAALMGTAGVSTEGDVVLLSDQDASADSEIEFTGLNSTYGEYIFKFYNLHPSMGSSYTGLYVEPSTGSYGVTTTSTSFAAYAAESGGTPVVVYRTGDDLAQSDDEQDLAVPLAEGPSLATPNDGSTSGEFHLFNPSSTTYVKQFYGRTITNTNIGGDFSWAEFTAGYYNTTSAITAIKFIMKTGNIDTGTIKMWGVK
jgi:hypothetical protein